MSTKYGCYIHLVTNIVMPLLLPVLVFLVSHHTGGFGLLYCSLLVSSLASAYLLVLGRRPSPVYLVNFSCYRPDEAFKYSHEDFVERSIELGTFTRENVEFQKKILERSGVGKSTYFPVAVASNPPDQLRISEARREGEMVMFGAIDELFANARTVKPADIDVLIVNCSLFSPTPSLAEMVVNRYKLREDVAVYNLSGMGCSAGIISTDLARQLLKVHSNSYALIVSTENITLNGYYGNKRSMLVTNCLFRMGGAAILLSNRRSDRGRSKYALSDLIRTHKGASDPSYSCVTQEEDDTGNVGVSLSKDLMTVAGEALRANITTLGPRVLPLSEQLRFLSAVFARKVLKRKAAKPCVPDFKKAFEHFCIHAGGRAILDELEKSLGLADWHMEPSRMTLYRFGNTSSSSLWYELAYSEAKGRIGKGDRVWQIAFGSGFKCNSLVWRALKDVEHKERYPWLDVIDEFPVDVPKVAKIAA